MRHIELLRNDTDILADINLPRLEGTDAALCAIHTLLHTIHTLLHMIHTITQAYQYFSLALHFPL